ncbi:hypothetical protein BDR26DRAFT_873535 [Obelidium mucronatum]|nr:hypothetical protein BDR26DRAFT_873535 [Obelidium mucronatum]
MVQLESNSLELSGPVTARLLFFTDPIDGSDPYTYKVGNGQPAPEGVKPINFDCEWKQVVIQDVRGNEDMYSLDTHGFKCIQLLGGFDHAGEDIGSVINSMDFSDTGHNQLLKPLAESILSKQSIDFRAVHVFGSAKRSSRTMNGRFNVPENTPPPATRVHVDQSHAMGEKRTLEALQALGMEPAIDDSCRYQIINIWIPLLNGEDESDNDDDDGARVAVLDWPIVMADSRTCPEESLVPVKVFVRGATEGENTCMRYVSGVDYFYWSRMRRNEALLIKCYDSVLMMDGSRSRCPHASFRDPRFKSGGGRWCRNSVEIRCLLVCPLPEK